MTPQVITASYFKYHAGSTYDDIAKHNGIKLIKRNKSIDHAIVSADLLEDLLELNDAEYVKSIANARRESASGKTYTLEQAFGDL